MGCHVRTVRNRVLALATGSALILAGCSSSSGGNSSDNAKPAAGGTLTFAASANPACLDPHQLSEGVSLNVDRQVVDSLTDQDPDSGKIVPWLATKWDINSDSTQFT